MIYFVLFYFGIESIFVLITHSYEHYSSNDYSLQWLTDENKYFLISPKDIITASQYDTDDRVKYLINHE